LFNMFLYIWAEAGEASLKTILISRKPCFSAGLFLFIHIVINLMCISLLAF